MNELNKLTKLDQIVKEQSGIYQALLFDFLRQPSLSATGEGILTMANMVAAALSSRGFQVEMIPTKNWPAIFAERKGKSDKTILFYNHYDVQPGDPLDEWKSAPFEPQIRDGNVYARGAMDDKGHLVCRISALDALLAMDDELPCTVKFLIEGEEEIGSPNLAAVLEKYQKRLRADLCLWEFGDVDEEGYSLQYLGYRGLLNLQLKVKTAKSDGHSGIWGNIQQNAVWRILWALTMMKSADGQIHIPGFYDAVQPPTEIDLTYIRQLPPMREKYKQLLETDTLATAGLDSEELYIQAVMRPSCNICGITGGYQGEGAKTIVPNTASAKVDFRLTPGQDPDDILKKVRLFLNENGFADIEITVLGKLYPSQTSSSNPFVKLISDAAESVYGKPQRIYPMCGGSGPAYLFDRLVGAPVFTAGIGNPNSAIHSPNENVRIEDFLNGIRHTAAICLSLGNQ